MAKERLTQAEAIAWERRAKAAWINVVTDAPSTVTLLRKTPEEMLGEAKAAGVEVTVKQRSKGSGEIVPLPGTRRETTKERVA